MLEPKNIGEYGIGPIMVMVLLQRQIDALPPEQRREAIRAFVEWQIAEDRHDHDV